MSDMQTYRPEPASQDPQTSDTVDLHAYWRVVVRRRWLIVPFFVAVVLVTMLITLRQTKYYEAVATIVIDLQAPRVLEKDSVQDVVETGAGGYWYSKEYFETQYRVIVSRAVGKRAVEKLQLGQSDKFLGLDPTSDETQREAKRAQMDPVAVVFEGLRVDPVKESRIARIRYEHPDPQIAALVANGVAEAYIAESLAVKNNTTATATDWLEKQLVELETKLDQSGKALFEFKKAHDIVAASWEDRQSMVSQRLTATNDALTKARVRRAELLARNEAIVAAGAAFDKGEVQALDDLTGRRSQSTVAASGARENVQALQPVASSPLIQALKIRYLDTRAECSDLRVKYLTDHPKLESCESKLGLVQKELRDEIKLAVAAARREYEDFVKTEANLQRLLDQTKSDAFGLNQYERDYLELKRSYDNNQRLYEMVLKRLKDTGVTGMLQVSNVRVLDAARPNYRPVRPNVLRNLLLAVLAGLVGGVALAFLAEYLDRTITGQDQVEEKLGLTFLGIVPSISRDKDGAPQDLFVQAQPKSAAAECLRSVRTNLLFMSPEKPLRTLLVTSAGPQEGKTTTATSLAITMANSGGRVLLVDADMRRPRIHRIFGAPNQQGLSSLILNEGTLHGTVRASGIENLWILPCGPIPPNPAELIHTTAFKRLLEEMSSSFDRVIIDSPPVGVVADSVVMSTHVDGTLMVLKAGKTDRLMAAQAVRQLRDVKALLLGAVLNDLDLDDQKYGKYSYYYQYGYYYGDTKQRGTKPQTTKA